MRILVADDDAVARLALTTMLSKRGYEIVSAGDGLEALEHLRRDPPPMVILDWMMPGMDGVDVCREIRRTPELANLYVILATSCDKREQVLEGLRSGANDYVIKPVDLDEIHARIQVAARVVGLQRELAQRVRDLEAALAKVKRLQGLLPICAYCKRVRDDRDYWHQVERYVSDHTDARFSHSICPGCYDEHVKPQLENMEES